MPSNRGEIFVSGYPHLTHAAALSDTDVLHSGHSISAIVWSCVPTGFYPDAFARLDRQVATCLLSRVSDIFEAIAVPARRAILDELVDRDGQTLFELCARLAMKHG